MLPEPPRRASGHREYPPQALERLRLIKRAQALGLNLDEVAELLALRSDNVVACGDMEPRIRSKIAELDDKLIALTELRDSLGRMLCECCSGEQVQQACAALNPLPARAGQPGRLAVATSEGTAPNA